MEEDKHTNGEISYVHGLEELILLISPPKDVFPFIAKTTWVPQMDLVGN